MDSKALFPVLEMGFCIWDMQLKPATWLYSGYWQATFTQGLFSKLLQCSVY